MSILGYSTSYFLPEYWGSTPLYGEKIIPLLDYILSTEYVEADKLANAFYMMTDKYKNTANLPISAIEEIINESGYGYVKDLFGNDEESIRLLVYLLVLIHQLKGTKLGIEVVLNLLKKSTNDLIFNKIGNVVINEETKNASGFSTSDYIMYKGFTTDKDYFNFILEFTTPNDFTEEECLASSDTYGLRISIDYSGRLLLSLGSDKTSWNIADSIVSEKTLSPSTSYKLKLSYDGVSYKLSLLKGEGSYEDFIVVNTTESLNIHKGILYLGVDNSTGTLRIPFEGDINIGFVGLDARNATITQWFEQFPVVLPEDTFIISTGLDVTTISADFFEKFSTFIKKYVYPTLLALEVKFNLENNVTFIPYARQRVKYIAATDYKEVTPLVIHPLTYTANYPSETGIKCWNPVTVLPVTSSIDFNIQPSNIKKGVSILGITGNVEELNTTTGSFSVSNSAGQTFEPTGNYNAFSEVSVRASNATGVRITPTTSQQVIDVPEGYAGLDSIVVEAVTKSIDNNIIAGNIKRGVSILGQAGSLDELNAEERTETLTSTSVTYTPSTGNAISKLTVTPLNKNDVPQVVPSTSQQTVSVPSGYAGNGAVTVGAVTAAVDQDIVPGNIKKGVSILGVAGTLEDSGNGITNVNDNYIVKTNGDLELITNGTDRIGAKDTSVTASFDSAYRGNNNIKNLNLGHITAVNTDDCFHSTFQQCTSLVDVNLSSLVTSSGSRAFSFAFVICTSLVSVNLSSLTTIENLQGFSAAFSGCTSLTTINLSSLASVRNTQGLSNAFFGCTSLSSVNFPSLVYVDNYAFSGAFRDCTSLNSLSFPALTSTSFGYYTNQFNDMLYGVTGCTVHFPSNLQSVIGSWDSVVAGFGGTNTVVLFDLPATS